MRFNNNDISLLLFAPWFYLTFYLSGTAIHQLLLYTFIFFFGNIKEWNISYINKQKLTTNLIGKCVWELGQNVLEWRFFSFIVVFPLLEILQWKPLFLNSYFEVKYCVGSGLNLSTRSVCTVCTVFIILLQIQLD